MDNVTALQFLEILSENKVNFSLCNVNEASSMVKLKDAQLADKNSASISQNIFGKLLYETINSKVDIPVSLKVFVDLEELWQFKEKTDREKIAILTVEGLKYEVVVYDKILTTIIQRRESPNFINFIAYAECKLEEILQNISPGKRSLFKLNFQQYGMKLTDSTKVGVLITEKAGNGAAFNVENANLPVMTMEKFADKNEGKSEIMDPVVFQVCYSLEVMQRHRITHNDLHCGNILVMKLPEPISMTFNLDEKIYRIQTEYIPLIFDWDRAYAASIGDNPRLDLDPIERNKFTKKGDLYTFLCTLYENTEKFLQEYKEAVIKEEMPLTFSLDPYAAEKLKIYAPYAKNDDELVYKLSGRQFREIFGNDIIPETVTSIMFRVVYDIVEVYADHGCRPTVISSSFPTPMEYIDTHFSKFLTEIPADEYSDFFVYTAPENVEQPTIYIDKNIATIGREKIVGKPRFSPQNSGYVKKDESYPELFLREFNVPEEIRIITSDPDNIELLETNVYEMKSAINILRKIVPYEHYMLCPLNADLSFTLGLNKNVENLKELLIECKTSFFLSPEKKRLNLIYETKQFSCYSINILDCKIINEMPFEIPDNGSEENLKPHGLLIHGTKKDILNYMKRNFSEFPHKLFGVAAVKLLDIN